jgi:hypothetical protein
VLRTDPITTQAIISARDFELIMALRIAFDNQGKPAQRIRPSFGIIPIPLSRSFFLIASFPWVSEKLSSGTAYQYSAEQQRWHEKILSDDRSDNVTLIGWTTGQLINSERMNK